MISVVVHSFTRIIYSLSFFSISRIKEAVTLLKMLCSHNSLLSKRLESYREESMLKVGEIGQIGSRC